MSTYLVHKGLGEGCGTVHILWGNKAVSKEGSFLAIFGKKENTGGIILGDNPAGHSFVLKDLVPTNFSK